MPHAMAPLSETGRLRLARQVVDQDWTLARAAERFGVSVTTANGGPMCARAQTRGAGIATQLVTCLLAGRSRHCRPVPS